jgi:exonuclease SbcC
MEILSVTLKDFKSHRDRHFIFQPGTNAICGENGAGKTSILEAIAWILFNYRGAYKIEDLIRNGATSAQATVAFISNRDGRTYHVQRCTTKGYMLFDPQLGERLEYKHIEEEVLPWLRQHLGVSPGTDLGKLFANTIGVPQGTFTIDFLQSPEKRKQVFDTILKVEEYKQAHQQMLSLEKYAKAEVENLERTIAQYEEALQDLNPLQHQRQQLVQEIADAENALKQLQTQLSQLQRQKDDLAAQTQQVQQLENQLNTLAAQIAGKQQTNQVLHQSFQRAQQSAQTCQLHLSAYQSYQQTEAALKGLEQRAKQRQRLLKQLEEQKQLFSAQHLKLTKLMVQIENLAKAQHKIEQLHPLVEQQEALDQQLVAIADRLNQLQAVKLEQQNLTRQLHQRQTEQTRLTQEIERLESLASVVEQIAELEQQRDRIQAQLSRIEAAKQFEAELRELVHAAAEKRDRHRSEVETALIILQQMQQTVPLLATASVDSALAAIQVGMELNDDLLSTLQQILADLSTQTSAAKLKQQLQQLKKQLESSYRQQAEWVTLESKTTQRDQLQQENEHLHANILTRQMQLAAEPEYQQQRSSLVSTLKQLADPRGQSQLLLKELEQHAQIAAAHQVLEQQQTQINQKIANLEGQLSEFADLDEQMEQQKQQQHHLQPAYLAYLQAQTEAQQLPQLETELNLAIAHLQDLLTQQTTCQAKYHQLLEEYDPQAWQRIETVYADTRSRADQLIGSLPQQQKLLAQLETQLANLNAIAEKCDRAKMELRQKEKVRKFITFARKTYKEAGPRITERYVQSISREADKLFRELMNRPNLALEWTKDYEILIQEGSHTRRFVNLSGGEQMCAALAVRLALLRVLADIDVAFFDEPTTNMDRIRRERLAEAIANIRSFRQLFVISHDDTFEKVTENVILVERQVD